MVVEGVESIRSAYIAVDGQVGDVQRRPLRLVLDFCPALRVRADSEQLCLDASAFQCSGKHRRELTHDRGLDEMADNSARVVVVALVAVAGVDEDDHPGAIACCCLATTAIRAPA